MAESEPIDLSLLQGLDIRPDWVEDLQRPETAAGEVVWGKVRDDGRGGGPRGRDSGRGPDRRDRPGGFRRDRGPGGPPARRSQGGPQDRRQDRPPGNRPPRGDRRDGPRRDDRSRQDDRSRRHGRPGQPARQESAPLEGWRVRLIPDPQALEQICRQIKVSGRSYSVFDIGRLFMAERGRYLVQFSRKPPPRESGKRGDAPPPPAPGGPAELFRCEADGSLWISRGDAVRHLLQSPALDRYYRRETVTVDPPKGNFTSVAVCGFSGTILGPPNHHDYPHNVARLHRERFANLSLERYKSRIRVERDEALLQKWQESVTRETRWEPLEPPAEGESAPVFRTPAEVEAHFLKHHAATAVVSVTTAQVPGNIPGRHLSRPLLDLLRTEVEHQQKFPMQLVQDLCREMERAHLKFFKRDRKTTFVCRSRPHFITSEESLSERIRSIIGIVRANPGIRYSRMVSILAPHLATASPPAGESAETAAKSDAGAAPPVESAETADKPAEAPAAEAAPAEPPPQTAEVPGDEAKAPAEILTEAEATSEAPGNEPVAGEPPAAEAPAAADPQPEAEAPAVPDQSDKSDLSDKSDHPPSAEAQPATDAPPAADTPPAADAQPAVEAKPSAAPAPSPLSPEEIAILQDLRWLVQEGFVTEFSNGDLHILGRPPTPPAPPKKPKAEKESPSGIEPPEAAPGGEGEVAPESAGEPPAPPEPAASTTDPEAAAPPAAEILSGPEPAPPNLIAEPEPPAESPKPAAPDPAPPPAQSGSPEPQPDSADPPEAPAP